MGHALYSTAPDYMNFLRMFLNRGALNGQRVLSEKALDWMLQDQTHGLVFRKMVTTMPAAAVDYDPFPDTKRTHSFGFLRLEDDVPGMRSAGSQTWGGTLNTHFWLDPKKDVAALFMTQSLPFVESRFLKTYESFERAVYAEQL